MQHVQTCEDRQLVHAYATTHGTEAQAAFRQIVERHGRWVFAAAYRQLQDRQLAEDAAQVVFILLAKRAVAMQSGPKLSGWLFNTLQYTVKNMRRMRLRRLKYELQAATERTAAAAPAAQGASELTLRLDAAVNRLSSIDRAAILLRFYQDCSFEEIAATLGITEDAARKRVTRAVASLRKYLGAGADPAGLSTTAAFGAALAPLNLTHTLTTAALAAKAGAALPLTLTAATKGTAWLMTLTKIKTAAVITSASLLVAVPATLAAIHYTAPRGVPAPSVTIPVALDTTAPADTTDDLAQFNRIYALDKDQNVKRVAPPFVDTRQAAVQFITQQQRQSLPGGIQAGGAGGGGGGVTMGTGRGGGRRTVIDGGRAGGPAGGTAGAIAGGPSPIISTMLFKWDDGKPIQMVDEMRNNRGGVPTSVLMQHIFGLAPDEIEGNNDVLGRLIDGDFVLRGAADDDHIRTGVAKVLSDWLGVGISLTYKDMDAKVYVLHGNWKYQPVDPAGTDPVLKGSASFINAVRQPDAPRVHIYSDSMQKSYGNGIHGGNGAIKDPKDAFFRMPLVRVLHTPVIIEADGIPSNLNFSLDDDPSQPSDVKAVLDHITEQTGLTWTQETRKLHHFFLELVNQ